MVDPVTGAVAQIAALDEKIDDLQDHRDTLTDPLEQAAMRYHRARPSKGHRGRLGCSRCYFVYIRVLVSGSVVVFGTDCSWCGKNVGEGLTVPVVGLAPFMK